MIGAFDLCESDYQLCLDSSYFDSDIVYTSEEEINSQSSSSSASSKVESDVDFQIHMNSLTKPTLLDLSQQRSRAQQALNDTPYYNISAKTYLENQIAHLQNQYSQALCDQHAFNSRIQKYGGISDPEQQQSFSRTKGKDKESHPLDVPRKQHHTERAQWTNHQRLTQSNIVIPQYVQ